MGKMKESTRKNEEMFFSLTIQGLKSGFAPDTFSCWRKYVVAMLLMLIWLSMNVYYERTLG